MNLAQLIFVGFNGQAVALDRDTGNVVWHNSEMHGGYVSLLLDGDRLIASSNGYMYCLDPLTGKLLWHNPLEGFGTGVASLASLRAPSTPASVQQAAAADADAASSAAGATAVSAGGAA